MTIHPDARRLTVHIGEADTRHLEPLDTETLRRAHLLSVSEDLPTAVVIVDAPERIDAFLPQVEEVVTEGLVTIEDVAIALHRFRQGPAT